MIEENRTKIGAVETFSDNSVTNHTTNTTTNTTNISNITKIEDDTKKSVVCEISGHPYCLIWSQPGMPQFVCIEPWHSLPSRTDGGYDWDQKPAAAILQPEESWSTTLSIAFVR